MRALWTARLPRAPGRAACPALEHCGLVTSERGTLRVTHAGTLSAFTTTGRKLWQAALLDRRGGRAPRARSRSHSTPLALANGSTVVTLTHTIGIWNARGRLERRIARGIHAPLDDSGTAANLTTDGELVVTGCAQELWRIRPDDAVRHDYVEFDHPVPPLFPDGSVLVRIRCLARMDRFGTRLWEQGLVYGPTHWSLSISRDGRIAAANSEGRATLLCDAHGIRLGTYEHPANFSEHPSGDWIALGRDRVARIDPVGKERWAVAVPPTSAFVTATKQAAVDARGCSYVAAGNELLIIDGDSGRILDRWAAPQRRGCDGIASWAILDEGVLGVVCGGRLTLLGD